MASNSTKLAVLGSNAEIGVGRRDEWFDPIEAGLRDRVREFIQTMIESELEAVLSRPRYARRPKADPENDGAGGVAGHRQGHRSRSLLGTFGRVEIAVPRARLDPAEGKTTGWKSTALRAYQRRTRHADSLIAGAYLAGTNTRRGRRALAAVFGGAVSKDRVKRGGRNGESHWDARPQRCTVHKHRNLRAHAPPRLHDEVSADYNDMIYAASPAEIEQRRRAFLRKWRLKCKAVSDSLEEAGDRLFTFTRLPPSQWKSARTTNAIERLHEEFKRRIKTHTVLPSAETAAMLFWGEFASGQITMRKVDGWQSLTQKLADKPIDLAA